MSVVRYDSKSPIFIFLTYNDDIDFREDANDETEDRCELEERDSLQTSPSNERLLKNFEQTECGNEIKQSIDLHARVEHKHFANLSIDSASKLILSLQDEIVRLRTDGEHWRKLAKEVSNICIYIFLFE
ncbi:hypothetical protein QR98_0039250 [Sarcoptes scabiei]|uniref:Uncharacterized protein n=1 Tax=Sarcoptes scabiei TaxID=52283 RepID=A0A132A3C9_SARSC|nr:hypothetical protein QR98_0039250 [Sarcoptes scabiei]